MNPINSPGAHALYLKVMLVTGCCGIAAAIAFVLLVDPYGLYGIVERAGFNAVKPGLTRYQNEIKVTRAIGFKPDIVLLGNSRAEIGFDPESPALIRAGGNVYNLSIPGTGIDIARGQFAYLVGAGIRPKTAILSLDFLDFVARKRDRPRENSEAPSNSEGARREHPVDRWFWRIDSLFSLTSVRDGLRTLALAHWPEAETLSRAASIPCANTAARVPAWFRRVGGGLDTLR